MQLGGFHVPADIAHNTLYIMQMSKWILGVPPGHPHDYDRDTSDNTGDSDNSSYFGYHSDIILTLQIVEI